MATTNERVANGLIKRDLELIKFLRGARKATVARIDDLARELQQLIYRYDPTGPVQMRHRELRIKRLLDEASKVIRQAYGEIAQSHKEQSKILGGLESRAALAAVNKAVGATVAVVPLSRTQLAAIANNATITGTPLKEWWKTQSATSYKRFAAQMRQGFRSGETVQQLTSRIADTKGFLKLERYQAEALVRTGFQSVTNEARRVTFENNTDVIKGVQQRSTLDNRTSVICVSYSGMAWSLPDYEPIGDALPFNGGPPRHVNCRSTLTAITKSWEELSGKRLQGGQGLPSQGMRSRFEASLRRQGLSESAISRAIQNAQASMDGQVPEDWTFEQWLKTKSATTQKEVLGAGRWELWKKGEIAAKDLVSESGRILTLEELQAKS